VAPPGWPQLILEAGFSAGPPVQSGAFTLDDPAFGQLDNDTLGTGNVWTGMTAWLRSGSVTRPANRQQGPLWSYSPAALTVTCGSADGRFDPDNTGGPWYGALNPMVPVRLRAVWSNITWPLFSGFADAWTDDGTNRGPGWAETGITATDAQKILAAITLPAVAAVGAGEATGTRITRILTAASWYTSGDQRNIAPGDSTVQAYTGGDTAWNLMQATADAEIGELYIDGAGRVTFRNRKAIMTAPRSATPQAVFGDAPGTAEPAGTERPYQLLPRARDDTTLANDIQATRAGGTAVQQVTDAASITAYLFPRSYTRSDLILTDDPTVLNWAQWVLYISKTPEDRLDQITVNPLRDPASLWPQVLGREIGDRIQVWHRPPGVASPIVKDVFIRGIAHAFDCAAGTWATTWTLQDAAKYGSFLTLDHPVLGQLDENALTF
jgi:hypothetical protein